MPPLTAVVLAGGLGTRMLPLTRERPKHLLEVAAEPLLAHGLRWLAGAGVRQVIVAAAHLAEQFPATLGDGSTFGVRLTVVTEGAPRGTGGALARAAASLRRHGVGEYDPVVVLNGDLLTGHDLRAQIGLLEHAPESVQGVVHVRTVTDPRAYGCVVADSGGRVSAFVEKPDDPPTHEVNAGTYVLRRRLIDSIPARWPLSFEREVLPALAERDLLRVHREQAYWLDVGSPAALARASADIVTGRWPGTRDRGAEALVAPGAIVGPGARLHGGTSISPGVRVESGAHVIGSVVMAGAVVEHDARVVDSVLGRGSRVTAGARLMRGVLADGERLPG